MTEEFWKAIEEGYSIKIGKEKDYREVEKIFMRITKDKEVDVRDVIKTDFELVDGLPSLDNRTAEFFKVFGSLMKWIREENFN